MYICDTYIYAYEIKHNILDECRALWASGREDVDLIACFTECRCCKLVCADNVRDILRDTASHCRTRWARSVRQITDLHVKPFQHSKTAVN